MPSSTSAPARKFSSASAALFKGTLTLLGCFLLLAALVWAPGGRLFAGKTAPVQGSDPHFTPGGTPLPALAPLPPSIPTLQNAAPRAVILGPLQSGSEPSGVSPLSSPDTTGPVPVSRRYALPPSHLSSCGACGIALYHAVSQFPGVLSINRFLGGDREVELLTDPGVLNESRLLDLLSTTEFEPRSGNLTQDQPWINPRDP